MVQEYAARRRSFWHWAPQFPTLNQNCFLVHVSRDNGCKQQLYVCIIHISLENENNYTTSTSFPFYWYISDWAHMQYILETLPILVTAQYFLLRMDSNLII